MTEFSFKYIYYIVLPKITTFQTILTVANAFIDLLAFVHFLMQKNNSLHRH